MTRFTQNPTGVGHLERKLVHRVDLAEVIHDEVEQGGPGGRGPVVFAGLVDFHFRHPGLLDLVGKERAVRCSHQPVSLASLCPHTPCLCVGQVGVGGDSS